LAFDLLSAVSVLVSVGIVASSWGSLPERTPSHFATTGIADAYGSKANVLAPVLLAVGLYLLFSVVQRIPPRFYNYPVRITADNAAAQYGLARACLAAIKATLSAILACGTWLTVQVALGHRQGLGGWFLPGVLLAVIIPMLWYGSAAYRQRHA
jgi:uncharacterized membrane protein